MNEMFIFECISMVNVGMVKWGSEWNYTYAFIVSKFRRSGMIFGEIVFVIIPSFPSIIMFLAQENPHKDEI